MAVYLRKRLLAGVTAAVLLLPGCVPGPGTETHTFSSAPSSATDSTAVPTPSGWVQRDGKTYYLNRQGEALTGWLQVDAQCYYLDPACGGAMVTGWLTLEGKRFFLRDDGTMATGWLEQPEGRYYLGDDGSMAAGWQDIGQDRYLFDSDGRMLTGWQTLDGQRYYLHPAGPAARGRVELEGRTHYFSSIGAEVLLVNPWTPLPEDYQVELVHFANVADGNIAAVCADALQRMWDACEAAGHRLNYCSGFRTQQTQERYFNSWCNYLMSLGMTYEEAFEATKKEVAYPGTSEHQLGLAVDLTDYDYRTLDEHQSKTATQQWLMAHCWEYGFILRYPEGTSDSTGIIYEPWHYRYVGPALAQELKTLGVTLETYLDMLTLQEVAP